MRCVNPTRIDVEVGNLTRVDLKSAKSMKSSVEQNPGKFHSAWLTRLILLPLVVWAALCVVPQGNAQAPSNNNFSNAMPVFGAGTFPYQGTFSGSNVRATRETNEPIHFLGSPFSSNSVWFVWTAPESGVVTFDTIGTGNLGFLDTVLAAYRLQGTNGVGSLFQLASDDDSGGNLSYDSLIRFPVVAGTNYYIALDGYRGSFFNNFNSSGQYVLNWRMGTNPAVAIGEIILSSSSYTVSENGGVATITVLFGGDPSGGANGPVSVDFFTADGTAVNGTNYLGTNGTLVFEPGETQKTFDIPILDNLTLNNNKTVFLALLNATNALLDGFPTSAILTIVDDEAFNPGISTAGEFNFSSTSYIGTENESFPAPFGGFTPAVSQFSSCILRDVNLPGVCHRSPYGVVVTVTRSAPARGRVMVDYNTEVRPTGGIIGPIFGNTFPAKQGIDFSPTFGTLVFDDYQMSASFIVPVYSNDVSNNAAAVFSVVLSNPRADAEEDINAPEAIVPVIGTRSVANITVYEVNETFRRFNFERALYRYDEYNPLDNNGPSNNGVRNVTVDVLLPGGGGGTVTVRMLQNTTARYIHQLAAGSDYATLDADIFENTPYSDGRGPIINESDFSDFQDTTVTFPGTGPFQFRQRAIFSITNDNTVEFNEDVTFEFINVPQGYSSGPNFEATVTILNDDQPAGAADREWNPEFVYTTQPPYNTSPGANNTVSGLAVQDDDRTVIVGDFTAVNAAGRNRIARFNVNGSVDLTFNPGSGANGAVETVVIYPSSSANAGKILIGGDFTSYNGVSRRRLARLLPNGSIDNSFNVGNGADGPVRSIAVQSDGKVIVAGDFTLFNDLTVNGIMRLNADGSLDDSFNPGTGADDTIWAVAVRDTGIPFTVARRSTFGVPGDRNLIDAGFANGSLSINYDFGSSNNVNNFRVYQGGVRILDLTTNGSGGFTFFFTGASTELEIVMNESGFGGGWFYQATVRPSVTGRSIYLAGEFTRFADQPLRGVARLNPDGSVDPTFNPGVSVDGPIYSMVIQPDNRVLLGGSFQNFQNYPRNSLIRLLSTGALDLDFHTGSGADDAIYTLAQQADGKIYLGGVFQNYNGTRRMGVARLFNNGALDTSFLDTAYNQFAGLTKTYSFDPPRFVNAIGLQSDGNVMIGGAFTNLGGNFSYNNPSFATEKLHAPFTRADKVTRFNVARLIGGYTDGPGNIEFDRNSMPFNIDENAGLFSAPLRRIDGRLGSAFASSMITGSTASLPDDASGSTFDPIWEEAYFVAPRSVGFTGFRYFDIPIFDDSLREGDETFDLATANVRGSINLGQDFFTFLTLGGEYIPLGAARGYWDSVKVTIADNDFDRGEFNFALNDFTINEDAGLATITVIRTNGSVGPVSVRVLLQNGTATADEDFVAPAGPQTLTFASGQTTNTFTVQLLDNFQIEMDETVVLILTNAAGGASLPGGLGNSVATATLTIVDNDFLPGRLRFAKTAFTNSENERFAAVTVRRMGGNAGFLSANFQTLPGGATSPADYGTTNGILTWNSGDSSPRTILIPLVSDGIVEGDESFTLQLLNPSVADALGDGTNVINIDVTIADGDAYGAFSFSSAYYETDENSGFATITVLRRGGIGGSVAVDYGTAPGTAIPGSTGDYNDVTATLDFLPGEISKTFRVPLLDDNTNDGLRTVLLTLSNPKNGSLGSVANAVLGIVDNEDVSTPAGSLDTTFSTASGANGSVFSLALQADNAIVMAGDFTEVGTVPRNRIARLRPNGTLDPTFDIGPGANGPIRVLGLQSDGRLIVGGAFSVINGTNAGNITRLAADGKVDSAFNPGSGADNPVFALAVLPDDKILVGGSFSTFNAEPHAGLVRLGTNGVVDPTLDIGSGFNGTVYALALQSDGKIVVGGEFASFNGAPRVNLLRLNPDGTLDTTFNPSFTINAAVRAIIVQFDGGIVIGGAFTTVNGVERRHLARLDRNGNLDTLFLAGATMGADGSVTAIQQQVDGKLIVGGDFRIFNNVNRGGITRLREDGTTDPTMNFGSGPNGFVAALAIQSDRRIILGGGFTEYDSKPRRYVARIYGGAIAGAGSIEFSAPEYFVGESGTNALITISRTGGTEGTVSANYSTLDGSAIAGRDYQATGGSVIFAEGETRRTFTIPITPNSVVDGDRLAYVQLNNPVGATLGLQPYASVTIFDDESVIAFTTAGYSVNENSVSAKATIGVARTGGTNSTVQVSFSTGGGTATAGSDYVSTNGTLTFLPGQRFKNFNVAIVDDAAIENNETVLLNLSSLTGSATVATSSTVLVIVDNDFAAGQFVFSMNNFVVPEFGGSAIITVIRTNGSSGPASVRVKTSNGTALSAFDYTATDRLVTFAEGETAKTVFVPITSDSLFEPDETFNVTLSDPSPGTSILMPTALVTISDDEIGARNISAAGSSLVSENFIPANGLVDPGETVTLLLGLRNNSGVGATNVTATLVSSPNVTGTPQTQSYGSISAGGGIVSRPFTLTASGVNGSRISVTLAVTNDGVFIGNVSYDFVLGVQDVPSGNSQAITIFESGPASPYPSVLNISGVAGNVAKVTVTLHNLNHTYPDDIDVLLVSPNGTSIMLMSDAGGNNPVNNTTITFDDNAASPIPDLTLITNGTYRPFNYFPVADNIPPFSSGTFWNNSSLATVIGSNPNGAWSLYVFDDNTSDAGSIVGGWSLNIISTDPVARSADLSVTLSDSPTPAALNGTVTYTVTVVNHGSVAADSVVLTNALPPQAALLNVSGPGGFSQSGNTLFSSLGNMAPSQSAVLTVTMQAPATSTRARLRLQRWNDHGGW